MSARDEAAQIVAAIRLPWFSEHDHVDREMLGGPVVDALIAAGWRKTPSAAELTDCIISVDDQRDTDVLVAAVLALLESSDG